MFVCLHWMAITMQIVTEPTGLTCLIYWRMSNGSLLEPFWPEIGNSWYKEQIKYIRLPALMKNFVSFDIKIEQILTSKFQIHFIFARIWIFWRQNWLDNDISPLSFKQRGKKNWLVDYCRIRPNLEKTFS